MPPLPRHPFSLAVCSLVSELIGIAKRRGRIMPLLLIFNSRDLPLAESRIESFFAERLIPIVSVEMQSVSARVNVSKRAWLAHAARAPRV